MTDLRNPLLILTTLALIAALSFLSLKASAVDGVRHFFDHVPDPLPLQASDPASPWPATTSAAAAIVDPPPLETPGEDNKDDDESTAEQAEGEDDEEPINYDENLLGFKVDFQNDLTQPLPQFADLDKFKSYQAINYHGPGRPTFAAYLSTRNSSIHDPYFYGAQQIAYRLLWDPRSRSEKYPFTVFVAPFIPQDQRDLLSAAGALVVELDLVPWHATAITLARWRDLFSKLNVWNQTDFSRIALLDTDAFPLENIDAIFDAEQAPEMECNRTLLNADDQADPGLDAMCEYVYAGVRQAASGMELNGGVYVLKPDAAMHRRLLREMHKDKFPDSGAEQAFLNLAYRADGPFPAHDMGRTWNGFVPQLDEEGKLKIIHDKLWTISHWSDRNISWALHYFNDTWDDMLALYQSADFAKLRAGEEPRPVRL